MTTKDVDLDVSGVYKMSINSTDKGKYVKYRTWINTWLVVI